MAAALRTAVDGLAPKAAQVISVQDRSVTYGCAPFALGAKASDGGALSYSSSDGKVATVDAAGKVTVKRAGTATITVGAAETANCKSATAVAKVKVAKAANKLKVKARLKMQTVKPGKATTIKPGKAFKVTGNKSKGPITYKLTSVPKKARKHVCVASNGKIVVKKALARGTYVLKLKVAQEATANYKGKTIKNVTLKLKN